ncbi:MAG: hypothetical protein NC400_13330 [Clostridium sp.]|nr:hypothetical protein [Clostridium sp.]
MIAAKPVDLRAKIKDYELMKARRNAEYLTMLDESRAQLERGETISFSMEELKEMEADDWKPTQKVLDWMHRTGYYED